MLFVDLVGFTPLSEGRDPEEVRELLSEYFTVARQVVGRYGGVIEKFIGDAVMAVWGTPVAAEGDAERAVRAALDLVAGVAELGARIGAPGLAARAGVVTGTVATTPGADGQAMVAGDPVNTAARVQSAAAAGAVLVDTTTRRLVGRAIDLELFGDLELKGKAQPATLWRAACPGMPRRGCCCRRSRPPGDRAGSPLGRGCGEGRVPSSPRPARPPSPIARAPPTRRPKPRGLIAAAEPGQAANGVAGRALGHFRPGRAVPHADGSSCPLEASHFRSGETLSAVTGAS